MLGRAAERFIRTKWASVQELAEELYATFSPDAPIQASSIIINQAAGQTTPPFVINRAPDAQGGSIQINRNGGINNFGSINLTGDQFGNTTIGGTTYGNINFGNSTSTYGGAPYGNLDFGGSSFTVGDFTANPGGGQINGGGGVNLGAIAFDQQEPKTTVAAVPTPSLSPFVLYGEVDSKISGILYAVRCWAVSPLNNSPIIGVVKVRFPQINPDEEIPRGTLCPVLCFPAQQATSIVVGDAVGYVSCFF